MCTLWFFASAERVVLVKFTGGFVDLVKQNGSLGTEFESLNLKFKVRN